MSGTELPRWADVVLIPLINLSLALLIAGCVVLIIGENPFEAMAILLKGALGSLKGWGYLLYYATNFTFTGLAVAVAFHAGLFNIGGEGQAYIGGLGAGMAGLYLGFMPLPLAVLCGIIGAMAFGAAWAFIPAYLQAKRGSHIVITTIMFNFIAASLMIYLLNNVFRPKGRMAVESEALVAAIPTFREMGMSWGVKLPSTPLNPVVFLAVIAAVAVWFLLWRTRLGYEIRTVGANPDAAVYGGIGVARIIIIAMLISGALAGLLSVNEIMGFQHRIVLEFVGGAGFVGIAVSLLGRSHPFGVILAALLFGILYQGGAELSFQKPTISRDMIVVIQGLVILFMGALEQVFKPHIARLLAPRIAEAKA
ncbi:MAG: ABC transporter permease [Hyphomicrobiales bacterium]